MNLLEQELQPAVQSYPEVLTDEHGEYCLIPLTQGQFAKVDPADFAWLSKWKWFAWFNPCTKTFYAARSAGRLRIYMHRVILGITDRLIHVDHRYGSTCDNRRCLLRPANHIKNAANSKLRKDNTSGYKGVSRNPDGRWQVHISINRKVTSLGLFDSPELGFEAYKKAADKHYGEFARY